MKGLYFGELCNGNGRDTFIIRIITNTIYGREYIITEAIKGKIRK